MDARNSDREKIERYTASVADANAEIDLLRQRFKSLNDDQNRYTRDNNRIWEELQKARSDLDEETISRIDFQNQVQTLMEVNCYPSIADYQWQQWRIWEGGRGPWRGGMVSAQYLRGGRRGGGGSFGR